MWKKAMGWCLVLVVAGVLGDGRAAFAESVRWVTEPPAAIQGGDSFLVQWEVSGFGAPLTVNGIVFDRKPADNAWATLTPVQIAQIIAYSGTRTVDHLNGNCLYTARVEAPAVSAATTFYFAPFAASTGEAAFDAAVPVLVTVEPAAASYMPDRPGATWVYRTAPFFGSPFTVVQGPGAEAVGCESTRVYENVATGAYEQFTVAVDGVALHRAVGFVPFGFKVETRYDPPLRLTNTEFVVGDAATSSGHFLQFLDDTLAVDSTYDATATVVGFEPVQTEAGSFSTVHLFVEVQFESGTVDTADIWVAQEVGVVIARTLVGHMNRILFRTNLP